MTGLMITKIEIKIYKIQSEELSVIFLINLEMVCDVDLNWFSNKQNKIETESET